METILSTSNNICIFVITVSMIGVTLFSIKTEQTFLPITMVVTNLALLVYHCYVLNSLPAVLTYNISEIYICLGMDFIWLAISFFGYLWIDHVLAIKYNKKRYEDSIAWFMNRK